MLNAIKKITNIKCEPTALKTSPIPTLSKQLQRKYSQGVQYNMKIIIKGDKCSGKTSVFQRLQGKPLGDYYPTEEIQVANVQWNYKNVDDVVKVEVWDVVDKGRHKSGTGIKMADSVSVSLDAEFIDVYKGTDGVILVMDVTKSWTFAYVQNEMNKIPVNLPVLILGNCCDMGHHRMVFEDTVRSYIASVQRSEVHAPIRYAESSMVNCFGLKYVYKFLALPFLNIQKKTLLRQLERNAEEMDIAVQEIDLLDSSSDYSLYSGELTQKRRELADYLGVAGNPIQTPSVIFGRGHQINRYKPLWKPKFINENVVSGEVKSVEEFVPDDEFDDTFFFEQSERDEPITNEEPDSEAEDVNPLVAEFQEDIDSDDELPYVVESNRAAHNHSDWPIDLPPSPRSFVNSSGDFKSQEIESSVERVCDKHKYAEPEKDKRSQRKKKDKVKLESTGRLRKSKGPLKGKSDGKHSVWVPNGGAKSEKHEKSKDVEPSRGKEGNEKRSTSKPLKSSSLFEQTPALVGMKAQ